MALYPSTSKLEPASSGPTEFLREDDEEEGAQLSWEEKLASKYYANLYREFAVCDLKHYKSGNFALRWRTEAEVLSGAGETSCGNTRCKLHEPTADFDDFAENERGHKSLNLATLELPFTYLEHGESKSALVKVVLCEKCVGKLMWKRRKDKERETGVKQEDDEPDLHGVGETRQERWKPVHENRDVKEEAPTTSHRLREKSRHERWDRDRDNLVKERRRERHRSLSPRDSRRHVHSRRPS
ncbi:protein fra10ac1 [Moniliophthora roreri]|uniref:Protein FRA10AC1 n=1 Tax=Moniliophthora roreri TaxID=221103 RepID=A0A0W0G7S5_MONRR|nr:protein fra10ac1 [Moniliophthora roreri]